MTKELTREEMHAYAERLERQLRRDLARTRHVHEDWLENDDGDRIDGSGPDGTWWDNRCVHQRTYLPGKW